MAAVRFSSDSCLLATGGLDGAVCIWDAATGELRHKLEGPGEDVEVRKGRGEKGEEEGAGEREGGEWGRLREGNRRREKEGRGRRSGFPPGDGAGGR